MGKILNLPLCFFAILIASVVFQACGDVGCMDNRSSIPYITFYSQQSPTQSVVIDSLSVYGIGQRDDSLLFDTITAKSLLLPLRNDKDTTRYVLRYDKKNIHPAYKRDTLTLVYHSYIYFASAECGAMFNYIIDSLGYTTYQIVSAELLTKDVRNQSVENIKLYFRTNE